MEFDNVTSGANHHFKNCYSSRYLFLTEIEESENTLACFCSKAQDVLPVVFLPLLNALSSAGVSGGFHNTLLG